VTLRDAAPTSRAMVVAVMVSMVAFLDSTVINLALPATEHDLGGGLALQQWVIDGYLLAMAAAILPGGSISDLFGLMPRPARSATRSGQQSLGRERTISSAVVVHAIDATRKQPMRASTALYIHAFVHPGALLTRVNRWLG
jgi:MFS family permease